jgi:prophage maintenance system killer protein
VDGNERVALARTVVFLKMNGYHLEVKPDDGELFIVDQVVQQRATVEDIARWLEKRMRK